MIETILPTRSPLIAWLEGGGPSRNRTGVQGFAVLCVTTPPSGLGWGAPFPSLAWPSSPTPFALKGLESAICAWISRLYQLAHEIDWIAGIPTATAGRSKSLQTRIPARCKNLPAVTSVIVAGHHPGWLAEIEAIAAAQ